jgi:hypothetical protein
VVRKYTGHPLLVEFCAGLIEDYRVPARNPVAFVKAVQHYATHEVKFFREYPERFQSPLRTIDWGIGDCDDKTILVASCARTFRIPTRLSILELAHAELDLAHVYPECFLANPFGPDTQSAWVPVDTVREYPWGHNPAKVAYSKAVEIDGVRSPLLLAQKFIGDKTPIDETYA